MSTKEPATMPQAKRKKSPKWVRVTVLLPRDLHRQVMRVATDERRLISPSVVVLVERGLASPATVMNTPLLET